MCDARFWWLQVNLVTEIQTHGSNEISYLSAYLKTCIYDIEKNQNLYLDNVMKACLSNFNFIFQSNTEIQKFGQAI